MLVSWSFLRLEKTLASYCIIYIFILYKYMHWTWERVRNNPECFRERMGQFIIARGGIGGAEVCAVVEEGIMWLPHVIFVHWGGGEHAQSNNDIMHKLDG